MKRQTAVIAFVFSGLALAAGLAVGRSGLMAAIGLVGLGIAAAALVDLRVTLLALVPAMVLLPELPLAVPVRTEDLLMVPLAAAWLARLVVRRERWPSTPLNRPLAALVAVEFAALLWGAFTGTTDLNPRSGTALFFFLKTVEVTLLYLMVVYTVRTPRDVRLFTVVLCASAAALGLWGMIERGSLVAGEAITGPAGHGGYSLLGLTFVVLLTTLVSLLLTQRSVFARALVLLAALPVTYSLLFTFSRQSYVGIAAAIGTLVWVRNRLLIIPALALALALPLVVPQVVEERAQSIVTGLEPSGGGDPYATRVHALLRRGPEVLHRSPVLGFGPAALPPGFLDNQYLTTLYYTGVIGLAVFLWLLWSALRTAHRSYESLTTGSKGLALAWLAATVGLALAGLAGSPFVAVRVRQVYWFLAALTVAATRIPGKVPEGVVENADGGGGAR